MSTFLLKNKTSTNIVLCCIVQTRKLLTCKHLKISRTIEMGTVGKKWLRNLLWTKNSNKTQYFY